MNKQKLAANVNLAAGILGYHFPKISVRVSEYYSENELILSGSGDLSLWVELLWEAQNNFEET